MFLVKVYIERPQHHKHKLAKKNINKKPYGDMSKEII
jgi:hypothetical protein